jgi:hypothetical protein
LRFLHIKYARFVFISSCLCEGSCLIYVICACLRIVVSYTYRVVFFCRAIFVLCFVYPMLLVSLDCPFSIAPSVVSNVYSYYFPFNKERFSVGHHILSSQLMQASFYVYTFDIYVKINIYE